MHVETWAGLSQSPDLRISQEVEIVPGCAATVACSSCPDHSPVSPGPGRVIRNMVGSSQMEKTGESGVWLFWGAFQVLRDTECHDTMFASHFRVEGVIRGSFGLRFFVFLDGTSGGPQRGHCD